MALSLGIVAVAGVFLGIRTRSRSAAGPTGCSSPSRRSSSRAGIALGHARGRRGAGHRADRGREASRGILPGTGCSWRCCFGPRASSPAPESLREPSMSPTALRIERTTRASRLGAVMAALVLIVLWSLPAWGSPRAMRIWWSHRPASCWPRCGPARGYAGLGLVIGQQATWASAAKRLIRAGGRSRRESVRRVPAGGPGGAASRCPPPRWSSASTGAT